MVPVVLADMCGVGYGSMAGGVNMWPGQPYFLVPQELTDSVATTAMRGRIRLKNVETRMLISLWNSKKLG